MTAEPLECAHCGTLVSPGAAVWAFDKPYCCNGCRTVAEIIHEGGWENFYERREGWSAQPIRTEAAGFDAESFEDVYVTKREDGCKETELYIEGVRCSACTWLLERAIGDVAGVEDVHVSYGTNRAQLVWNPEKTSLSMVAQRALNLGYKPLAADSRRGPDRDLIARLGVAGFCALNAMFMSLTVYLGWFHGMADRYASLFRWGSLVVATPAVLYSAAPFFDRAFAGLRHRVLHMDVPIALAITIMYVHGVISTLISHDAYLDSLTMLIAFLLAGRLVEQAGRNRAEAASAAVMASAPATARRLVDGEVEEVSTSELREGDRVLVATGEALPIDGVVLEGHALADFSMVTGESAGRAVSEGDEMATGAVLLDGHLEVEATAVGSDTLLAKMAKMVSQARSGRGPTTQLADRIAPWFTGITLAIAALTFLMWSLLAGPTAALPITIAVLVVACPCALALGTPAAIATGLGAAARRGAYIRSGEALDGLARADLVIFDKTGTLTEGQLGVVSAENEVLRLATGLERASQHPIATAILAEAAQRRIPIAPGEDIVETPGRGIRGRVEGRDLELRSAGTDRVALFEGEEQLGIIELRDRLRADTAQVLEELTLPHLMLTGDDPDTADRIASEAGGLGTHAQMDPLDKAAFVEEQRQGGRVVVFAGDGINDAPALTAADVWVAMGSGASSAILAADAVVLSSSLRPVVDALKAAHITRRTLLSNSLLSIGYNLSAVTLAVAGLINPLVAAILMPLSSLTVVLNALAIERRMAHGHRIHPSSTVPGAGGNLRLAVRESRS